MELKLGFLDSEMQYVDETVLEMRPRNLRPCGMQQALSSCRPGTTRCTPFLRVIRGQRGLKCESCSE